MQQAVRLLGEPEPFVFYLPAFVALVYQVQRAAGGDAGPDVAGDVGVVAADQLGVRAYPDAEQRQQDQVDSQAHQHDHVGLAGQDAGNPPQDLVQARGRHVGCEIVG